MTQWRRVERKADRLVLIGCVAAAGCGGSLGEPPTLLEVQATTMTPELIKGPIHFTILGRGFNRSGDLDVAPASSMTTVLSDIPAGQGYALALVSDDGQSSCDGGATFDIVEGRRTVTAVSLACRKVVGKPVIVNATANECPEIASVVPGAGVPRVGRPIVLAATADDPDHAPMALTYTWLADSGVFADPHVATTSFTCTEPGLATLVLSVSDGDLQCDQFLGVKITCVACSGGGIADAATCEASDGGR